MTSQSVKKRDLILSAAEKVFLSRGFYLSKIEEIAKNAGVAKGTIYIYFRDKESIYIALVEKRLGEIANYIESIASEDKNSCEKLEKIFTELCRYREDVQKLHPLISVENLKMTINLIKRLRARIIPKIKKIIDEIAKIVEMGIKGGEIKKMEPYVGAMLFLESLRLAISLPLIEEIYSIKFKDGRDAIYKTILNAFFNGIYFNETKDGKC